MRSLKRRRKYKFKTKPRRYQVQAVKFLLRNKGGALFMPMRSGKTKVAIDASAALQKMLDRPLRVLVVCPKSVLPVWPGEIRKHCPDDAKIKWRFVNFESVYTRERIGDVQVAKPRRALEKWNPDIIIVDESHRIGDPTTNISAFTYKLQKVTGPRMKIIMTGTPYHRGKRLLIFGQFKFLNEGIFGTGFTGFKNHYAKFGGFGGYMLVGYRKQKQMRKKIQPEVFQMAHIAPVAPIHQSLEFKLEEAEEIYEKVANEQIYRDPSGWVVTADHPFSRAQKLATIESGWVKDDDGQWHSVGNEKLRTFDARLGYYLDQDLNKIVVFCSYVRELKDCVLAVKRAGYTPLLMYGQTPLSTRETRLAYFDECDGPAAFVCQVRTGSMGLDMSAASLALYYNHIMGAVDYDQSMARIRKYRDQRQLVYEHLYGFGCVGGVSFAGLHANLDLANHFANHPDLLSYKEAG